MPPPSHPPSPPCKATEDGNGWDEVLHKLQVLYISSNEARPCVITAQNNAFFSSKIFTRSRTWDFYWINFDNE